MKNNITFGVKIFLFTLLHCMVFIGCRDELEKSDNTTQEAEQEPEPEQPVILSFSFEAAENDLPNRLIGVIDNTQNQISITTQEWIENISKLKAVFESNGIVTVGGVPQESNITANDFRRDVEYVVTTEDNIRKSYTVIFNSPQSTGLPVIRIDTENKQDITSKEDYIKTNIIIEDPNNKSFSFINDEYNDGIRGRGNSSWSYPKRPYRLKFDKKTSLFGHEAAKSWVLLANYLDPTLIMNALAFELGQRFRLPFTNHYVFVELFLNGEYQGNYMLTEQIQVGKGRVDINDKEGYLVEMDVYYDDEPKFRTVEYDLPVMIKSPEDLTDESGYDFVKAGINELTTRVFDDAFPDNGYRDLIDMDIFIDYLLITEIVNNKELGWPKSVYMYKDAGVNSRIGMGPLWDYDWAFGYTGNAHDYFADSQKRSYIYYHSFFRRFFEDPVFRSKYKMRWNEMYADVAGMETTIDKLSASLNRSQQENFKRWPEIKKYFPVEIEKMKLWWRQRVAYLNTEFNKM